MRDFRKFDIWKDSMLLTVDIYKLVERFPNEEKFGLRSQLTRCAVSIPSNIAEGCSRTSELEFKRFLEISMGSSFELETQIRIASELGFITKDDVDYCISRLDLLQKRLNALITKIKLNQNS